MAKIPIYVVIKHAPNSISGMDDEIVCSYTSRAYAEQRCKELNDSRTSTYEKDFIHFYCHETELIDPMVDAKQTDKNDAAWWLFASLDDIIDGCNSNKVNKGD